MYILNASRWKGLSQSQGSGRKVREKRRSSLNRPLRRGAEETKWERGTPSSAALELKVLLLGGGDKVTP